MISFKANYIDSTNIYKINGNNYEKYPVNFVELNTLDEYDRRAAFQLARDWNDGLNNFSTFIAIDMKDDYIKKSEGKEQYRLHTKEPRYFALTSQSNDFDLLDFRKIFGITEIDTSKKDSIHLNYLQAHPEHNMLATDSKFRLIGTTMLEMLKKLFPQKDITLTPTEYSKVFYRKNGFVRYVGRKMIFRHK